MASLKSGCEFMLSKWGGDKPDGFMRENKYEIYATSEEEDEERNYRAGRRIDYGETYQTDYGRMTYHVRKTFRKILHAANMGADYEIEYMYRDACNKNDMHNFNHAIELAWLKLWMGDEDGTLNVVGRAMKSIGR